MDFYLKLQINAPISFEWDERNKNKNLIHHVYADEAEEVFLNRPLIIFQDKKHSSNKESRQLALGNTFKDRRLSIIFTIRNNKIRVISARDMNKKESIRYEQSKA
jgi:uncharacterized DUF497 family protein